MTNPYPYQDRKTVAMAYAALHRDLIDQALFRSCLNCLHFAQPVPGMGGPSETCALYKTRPPASVIVFSCGPAWEADVPF